MLSGAAARVLWEPYPYPDDVSYKSRLYTLDTLHATAAGDNMVGYAYSYEANMHDSPLWSLLKFHTAGYVEEIISNGTEKTIADVSLSWMVKDRESACVQPEPLSHGPLVLNPEFSVINNEQQGQVTDLISILQSGSTMRMVSHLDNLGTFAYPTYAMRMYGLQSNIHAISTWLPGDIASHMPVRVHNFDFSGDTDFETYSDLHTENLSFAFDFKMDQLLKRTDVFLDPCWDIALAMQQTGEILEGSVEKLTSAIQSGARVLIHHFNGSIDTLVEAEEILILADGYVLATAKMGVTPDHGITWQEVQLSTDGSWVINQVLVVDTGIRTFFTDKALRPYRFTLRNSLETEGSFVGARERIKSGLMPRIMIELSGGEQRYLGLESVRLSQGMQETYCLSYRASTLYNAFKVFVIGMSGYFRADEALYRGTGVNVISETTTYETLTLFFEEQPDNF